MINHPPHAYLTSRNVIAIFDSDCTKCVAHSGEHPTSCLGTSEDAAATLFGYAYTEVVYTTWREVHLMLQNTRNTRLQSKNMQSQNVFTAWLLAYLIQRNIRKHYAVLETISPPKWRDSLIDYLPHASQTPLDAQ